MTTLRLFTTSAVFAASLTVSGYAFAQAQQAGNDASTNADETFQKLIEQCDNVDVLVLRARVRLLLGRTTEDAAAEAGTLMDQGLAKCGEGMIDDAKALLNQSIAVANAGAEEKFGTDASADTPAKAPAEEADSDADADEDKPWWKVW